VHDESASNAKRGMHAREGLDVNTSSTRRRRRQSERAVAATAVAGGRERPHESIRVVEARRLSSIRLLVARYLDNARRDDATTRRTRATRPSGQPFAAVC